MTSSLCFICDESFSDEDSVIVKERGIKTFIESSNRRRDGKHSRLQGVSSVKVHVKCQKSYNKEHNIAAALSQHASCSAVRRSHVETFDFKNKCVLCAEDASDDFKKSELKKSCLQARFCARSGNNRFQNQP